MLAFTCGGQGADECGWRNYPPAGMIRYEVLDPMWYAQADVMERVVNSKTGLEFLKETSRQWQTQN
jgi:hypothetical protein